MRTRWVWGHRQIARRLFCAALGVLCGLSPSSSSRSQPAFRPVPSVLDFPQSAVEGIAQDSLGFLWILTLEGLVRFDGLKSDLWPMPDEPRLSPVFPFPRIWVDRFNALWLLAGEVSRRLEPGRLRWQRVAGLVVADSAGHPWRWYANRWARWNPLQAAWREVVALSPVEQWLYFDGRYALALDADQIRVYRIDVPGQVRAVSLQGALAARRAGQAFEVLTRSGIWLLPLNGDRMRQIGPAPEVGQVRAVWVDPDGAWWVGGSAGLARWQGESWRFFGLEAPRPEPIRDLVRVIFRDRNGILWVGSNWGLYRQIPHDRPFYHTGGEMRFVSAFVASAEGELLVGAITGALWRLGKGGSPSRISFARDPGPIWALARTPDGAIWIGANAGLFRLTSQRRAMLFRRTPPINQLVVDSSGVLWVGTSSAIYRFRPPALWDSLPLPPLEGIRACYPEGDSLWIGTDRGLFSWSLRTGRLLSWPLDSLRSRAVTYVGRDRHGTLWVCTAGGLFQHRGNRFRAVSLDPEAPSRMVYGFVEDDRGALWLSTNRALYRLDPRSGRFWSYRSGPELGIIEFNRGAFYRDPRGDLWFGGDRGVLRVEAARWQPDPQAPRPILRLLRWQDGPRAGERFISDPSRALSVRYSWKASLSIELSAVGYLEAERFRFAYALQRGRERSWVELGSRRSLFFGALRPGRYTLWVRSANADGLWGAERMLLELTITPPWWETWTFRLALLGGLLAGLAFLFWIRIQRLRERAQLRARLAADLHDELGSELGLMAMEFSLRAQQIDERDEQAFLNRQADRLRDLGRVLSDLVWSLDPRYDTLWDWLLRLRATASGLLGEQLHWSLQTDIPDSAQRSFVLPSDVRFHLLRLLREALYNVRQHARASRVEIFLSLQRGELLLRCRDDGVGFDPEKLPRRGGLHYMEARARALRGRWSLRSAPGKGTQIEIRVPLPRSRDALRGRGIFSCLLWRVRA
jgi:ligand-binding sensor domain-containing protein/signal transduction histidine kinase